jgi:hypothetical protein
MRKCDDDRSLRRIRDRFQLNDRVIPAPWAFARITVALGIPEALREGFFAEQFEVLVRTAISLVAIVHVKGGAIAGETAERELQSALRLVGSADLEMVVAIAGLYDGGIAGKVALLRRHSRRAWMN